MAKETPTAAPLRRMAVESAGTVDRFSAAVAAGLAAPETHKAVRLWPLVALYKPFILRPTGRLFLDELWHVQS